MVETIIMRNLGSFLIDPHIPSNPCTAYRIETYIFNEVAGLFHSMHMVSKMQVAPVTSEESGS